LARWELGEPFLIAALFQVWSVLLTVVTARFTRATFAEIEQKAVTGQSADAIAEGSNPSQRIGDVLTPDYSPGSLSNIFARSSDAVAIFSSPIALLIAILPKLDLFKEWATLIIVGSFVVGLLGYVLILNGKLPRLGWFSIPALAVILLNLGAAVAVPLLAH